MGGTPRAEGLAEAMRAEEEGQEDCWMGEGMAAVDKILERWRVSGGYEARVAWTGTDPETGEAWPHSCVPEAWLSADLRRKRVRLPTRRESMGFTAELRRKTLDIWEKEKQHPFITGIGDGTLPLEKFRYYMRQDYVFLIESCRAVGLAMAKAQDLEDMGWFARLLHETLNTEMSLHVEFSEEFGIAEEDLRSTKLSPTCLAYTRHLLATASFGSIGETAVALLPCWWGYSEIGRMLYDRGLPTSQPLYARWIEMYSSPEFADLAAWLRSFIDRTAPGRGADELRRWEETFFTSSRYEYMFWDAAYRLEEWPV